MNDPQPNDPMLQEARRTFAAFYESATMADAMLMEALIHAWANVTQGMKIPRDRVSAEHRAELERVVDGARASAMAMLITRCGHPPKYGGNCAAGRRRCDLTQNETVHALIFAVHILRRTAFQPQRC